MEYPDDTLNVTLSHIYAWKFFIYFYYSKGLVQFGDDVQEVSKSRGSFVSISGVIPGITEWTGPEIVRLGQRTEEEVGNLCRTKFPEHQDEGDRPGGNRVYVCRGGVGVTSKDESTVE